LGYRQPGGVIGFPSKIVGTIEDQRYVFVLGKGFDVELSLGQIEIGPLVIFGNIHGDVDGPRGASHAPVGHVSEGSDEHAPLGLDFESFRRRNDHYIFERFRCQTHLILLSVQFLKRFLYNRLQDQNTKFMPTLPNIDILKKTFVIRRFE
jgi:hypothetical protein